jgi:predicted DNA-binding ArsR family transcriptional regulator
MEAVISWLKWTYNTILTEEFIEALINLEDAMGEEKLLVTKVHEVLKAVMLVQEINEDPGNQMQRMAQEIEEIKEIECSSPEEDDTWGKTNKMIREQLAQVEENIKRKIEELDELIAKNNVTIEEVKEISEVLNYGEQSVIENEIHVGTNQAVPMNMHHSIESKKREKSTEAVYEKKEEKRAL